MYNNSKTKDRTMQIVAKKIQNIPAPLLSALERAEKNWQNRKVQILLGAGLSITGLGLFSTFVCTAGLAVLGHGVFAAPPPSQNTALPQNLSPQGSPPALTIQPSQKSQDKISIKKAIAGASAIGAALYGLSTLLKPAPLQNPPSSSSMHPTHQQPAKATLSSPSSSANQTIPEAPINFTAQTNLPLAPSSKIEGAPCTYKNTSTISLPFIGEPTQLLHFNPTNQSLSASALATLNDPVITVFRESPCTLKYSAENSTLLMNLLQRIVNMLPTQSLEPRSDHSMALSKTSPPLSMTVQKDPHSDKFSFLFSNGIEIQGSSNEFKILFKNAHQTESHLNRMIENLNPAAPKAVHPILGLPAPKSILPEVPKIPVGEFSFFPDVKDLSLANPLSQSILASQTLPNALLPQMPLPLAIAPSPHLPSQAPNPNPTNLVLPLIFSLAPIVMEKTLDLCPLSNRTKPNLSTLSTPLRETNLIGLSQRENKFLSLTGEVLSASFDSATWAAKTGLSLLAEKVVYPAGSSLLKVGEWTFNTGLPLLANEVVYPAGSHIFNTAEWTAKTGLPLLATEVVYPIGSNLFNMAEWTFKTGLPLLGTEVLYPAGSYIYSNGRWVLSELRDHAEARLRSNPETASVQDDKVKTAFTESQTIDKTDRPVLSPSLSSESPLWKILLKQSQSPAHEPTSIRSSSALSISNASSIVTIFREVPSILKVSTENPELLMKLLQQIIDSISRKSPEPNTDHPMGLVQTSHSRDLFMTVQKDPHSDKFSFIFSNGIEINGSSNEFTIFFKNAEQADDHLKRMKSIFESSHFLAAPPPEDRPMLGLPAQPVLAKQKESLSETIAAIVDPTLERKAIQIPSAEQLPPPSSLNRLWNQCSLADSQNISTPKFPKAAEEKRSPAESAATPQNEQKEDTGPGSQSRLDDFKKRKSELDAQMLDFLE
jgi:hypothetical protein